MEVKQSEVNQANWEEWNKLKLTQVCSECGGELDIRTVPERESLIFGCPTHPDAGFRQRTSYTEDHRRGVAVPLVIKDKIEASLMVSEHVLMDAGELRRAMNLLQMRFPAAIKDLAGASLFIHDCLRLGLDPLIQPAEAVPVPFRTKDSNNREKYTVAMVVTEDGALSMAARGCAEEYDGAPATMPLLDYLLREHPQRSLDEVDKMAARTAKQLCDDEQAWVWVALGKRRSADIINPVYGYFTRAEQKKAADNKLPAGSQPGNQARVRAVKRWVRENFPEARQKMLEYTRALNQRTGGIPELQEFIDAEYTVITGPPDKNHTLISRPQAGTGHKQLAKPARTKSSKRAEHEVGDSAKRYTNPGRGDVSNADKAGAEQQGGGETQSAAPSEADETTSGLDRNTHFDPNASEAAAGDGFSILLSWHSDALKSINWSWNTARSWISSKFPDVNAEGTPAEVLSRLSRQQADIYTRELQNRAGEQPSLFN